MLSHMRSLTEKYPRLPITRTWVVGLVALVICLLAYGLLLPKMGFYWDDWPWVWMAHVSGPASLLTIDQTHRPLAGVILWLSYQLAGVKPLNWQILNLIYRWLGGLTLFWALGKLWSSHKSQVLWVTLLFLVYPAFNQQYVAVNSSRHILPEVFFFLSLGTMLMALRQKRISLWLTTASIAFSLTAMLSTEYYYGLELIRPAVVWLAMDEEHSYFFRLRRTLLYWLPFLLVVIAIFAWRYVVAQSVNYPVTLTAAFAANPILALKSTFKLLVKNIRVASISAYGTMFAFPQPLTIGQLNTRIYWLLVVFSGVLAGLFLYLDNGESRAKKWWWQGLLLGMISLLVGSLPFLATGIGVNLGFPHSRTLLPMMLGGSLVIGSLVDVIPRLNWAKVAVISALLGLSVGAHFQNALVFQQDWTYQKDVFWQLFWRVPSLEANTALITTELPITHSTDNSLTAPVNWIYAQQPLNKKLPYLMLYLRQRVKTDFHKLPNNQDIIRDYGTFHFSGSTDKIVLFFDNYPGCLKVLHPKFDSLIPHLPLALKWSLPRVDLDLITSAANETGSMPEEVFGVEPQHEWCYYFEKADLARQLENWEEMTQLGKEAFSFAESRKKASENLPFIQGYAYSGEWQRAEELTSETQILDRSLQPMLCLLWRDIVKNAPQSEQKERTQQNLAAVLNCGSE
jgi:hypothetical protein